MNISSVVSLTLSFEQVGNNATNGKENSDTEESDLQSLDLFYQPTRHGSWYGRKVTKSNQGNQGTYTLMIFLFTLQFPKLGEAISWSKNGFHA